MHYIDTIMSSMASQIPSLAMVYSTVYLGADQRKHQISTSLAFVRGINWWPVNSLHKGPVTCKMFPSDDIIMNTHMLVIHLFQFLSIYFFLSISVFECIHEYWCIESMFSNWEYDGWALLVQWGRDKMAEILQTTFSNALPWIKIYVLWLIFHWSLFLRFQLIIFQNWFR